MLDAPETVMPCPLLAARSLPPAPCRPLFAALNATLLALSLTLPGLATPALSRRPLGQRQAGRLRHGPDRRPAGARLGRHGRQRGLALRPIRSHGQAVDAVHRQNTNGGLGDDDIYSLTCDKLGRVWAGTGRDGVSVFNGKAWQTYDRLTGPLGCHVTALATSPVTGDVWGAPRRPIFLRPQNEHLALRHPRRRPSLRPGHLPGLHPHRNPPRRHRLRRDHHCLPHEQLQDLASRARAGRDARHAARAGPADLASSTA